MGTKIVIMLCKVLKNVQYLSSIMYIHIINSILYFLNENTNTYINRKLCTNKSNIGYKFK